MYYLIATIFFIIIFVILIIKMYILSKKYERKKNDLELFINIIEYYVPDNSFLNYMNIMNATSCNDRQRRKHLSNMGIMRGFKPCRFYMSKEKYRKKILDYMVKSKEMKYV